MKTNSTTAVGFSPITFTITIESEDELRAFAATCNVAIDDRLKGNTPLKVTREALSKLEMPLWNMVSPYVKEL